ncbi:MAG: hypothetical protein LC677_14040 [Halomonas sp.]|nr:hypothetical protein [Halomonas sp.]
MTIASRQDELTPVPRYFTHTLIKGVIPMTESFVFHRRALSEAIVSGLTSEESLVDDSEGLFLAAPRGTGKSTFLCQDLILACEEQGWEVVYIDLWTHQHVDLSLLVNRAIMAKLRSYAAQIKTSLNTASFDAASLSKVLTWDFSHRMVLDDATLTEALQALHDTTGRIIILFIDEAQLALTTAPGMNAMFALKAARDAISQEAVKPGLRLVFTSSRRDKLAQLMLGQDQNHHCQIDCAFADPLEPPTDQRTVQHHHFTRPCWPLFHQLPVCLCSECSADHVPNGGD